MREENPKKPRPIAFGAPPLLQTVQAIFLARLTRGGGNPRYRVIEHMACKRLRIFPRKTKVRQHALQRSAIGDEKHEKGDTHAALIHS